MSFNILSIETSCDDTSMSYFHQGRLKGLISWDQQEMTQKMGGIIPEVASREHSKKLPLLLEKLMQEQNFNLKDIDLFACTNAPGLLGPLLMGVNFTKALSLLEEKPLIGIDHLMAHIEAYDIEDHSSQELSYPYLSLLVSGGHCQFMLIHSPFKATILSKSLDDAPGECFDKGARMLGIRAGTGVDIARMTSMLENENLAQALSDSQAKGPFNIPNVKNRPLMMSFSGIKTALSRYIIKENIPLLSDDSSAHLKFHPKFLKTYQTAWYLEDIIVKTLVNTTKKLLTKLREDKNTLKHLGLSDSELKNLTLVLGGGVANNQKLRTQLSELSRKLNFHLKLVPRKFCTDNAAMIGHLAYKQLKSHTKNDLKNLYFEQGLRLNTYSRSQQIKEALL